MFDLNWSRSEMRLARRIFDQALDRELTALIQESKKRMNQVSTPDQLWEMERWLTEQRKEIDRTYDFRYSVLPVVFAKLLYRRVLSDGDLDGLGPEKIDLIRRGFGPSAADLIRAVAREHHELGSIPMRSLTAHRIRCVLPRYRSVV